MLEEIRMLEFIMQGKTNRNVNTDKCINMLT